MAEPIAVRFFGMLRSVIYRLPAESRVVEGFLKRLSQAYEKGVTDGWPEPPRLALALGFVPFPNSDWSYGGSLEIGAPERAFRNLTPGFGIRD